MMKEVVASRSDVLLARLKCSLQDLAEEQDRDPNELASTVEGQRDKLLEVAKKHRNDRAAVIAFFRESAGLFDLSDSAEYFEFGRRFKKGDPRKAYEVNAERLWLAWAEFLHGSPLPAEQERR